MWSLSERHGRASRHFPELRTEREGSLPKVTQQLSYKAKTTRNLETNPRILRKRTPFLECKFLPFRNSFLRSTSLTYLVFLKSRRRLGPERKELLWAKFRAPPLPHNPAWAKPYRCLQF